MKPKPRTIYILTAVTKAANRYDEEDRVPVEVFTSRDAAEHARSAILRAQEAAGAIPTVLRYDILTRLAG